MVRRFCNGAVALSIALTACAAFPRAVMAIDLSRFYGHSNSKRTGKLKLLLTITRVAKQAGLGDPLGADKNAVSGDRVLHDSANDDETHAV